jgi:outer membrane lipase/esterase
MSRNWMRRGLLALASAFTLLVAACGSGTIESRLQPSRIVSFGDSMSFVGTTGNGRYTVNDGTSNNWTLELAARFGLPLSASLATANARVNSAWPAAAGVTAASTVSQQVDAFLASGAIGANDLLIINAGTADIVAEMSEVTAGAQTSAQMVADAGQAGRDLAAQVRRLVDAGAKHVAVSGPYHLGRSPWAASIAQTGLLTEASNKFNEELLVAMVDQGANVLYVDAALLFNLMIGTPEGYDMTNATTAVCTSTDAGPGIGIGPGSVNSSLCTPSTVSNSDYNRFMFADPVYVTPQAQRKLGEHAFDKIRNRW